MLLSRSQLPRDFLLRQEESSSIVDVVGARPLEAVSDFSQLVGGAEASVGLVGLKKRRQVRMSSLRRREERRRRDERRGAAGHEIGRDLGVQTVREERD